MPRVSCHHEIQWWRQYKDEYAGHDGTSVRTIHYVMSTWLKEQERIRGEMTTDEQRAHWDEVFAEDEKTVREVLKEMETRMSELSTIQAARSA